MESLKRWTDVEPAQKLDDAEFVIAIKPSQGDVDPAAALKRARLARSQAILAGLVVLLGAGVLATWLLTPRQGFTLSFGWILFQVPLQIFMSASMTPRIFGVPPEGSHAFVLYTALISPTKAVRTIAGRWLVIGHNGDQQLVTQEERWDIKGPHAELEYRWHPSDRQIISATESRRGLARIVLLQFADSSTLGLRLPRSARQRLLAHFA